MEGYEIHLKNLEDACLELANCKFIVAELKIMKLLKVIADSPVLFSELERCLEDFNYEFEYLKAKLPSSDVNKISKFEFQLPVEDSKKVALIFRILYDIDTKQLDLQKFINQFYVVEDEPYASYMNFATSFVLPFLESYKYLITGIKSLEEVEVCRFTDKLQLQERAIVDIASMLKKLNEMIESSDLDKPQKEEMRIATNGFANSLISLNPEHILVCWIGFKNTIKDLKKSITYLKRIEEKLKLSNIFNYQ